MKTKNNSNYYVEVSSKRNGSPAVRSYFENFMPLGAEHSIKECCELIKNFIRVSRKQGDSTCYKFRIVKREERHTIVKTFKPVYPARRAQ